MKTSKTETSKTEIGAAVDPSPALRPAPVALTGRFVTLRPFDRPQHAEALYRATHGAEQDSLWRYMHDGPFADFAAFEAAFAAKQKSTDPLFFAILDNNTGLPVGQAAYLRIDPPNRVIEVGNIVFSPALQHTGGATEAMYLMARHAFDDLGYRRYEWKCNVLNQPSRQAALRLGFAYEGTFRQHMIVKGRNRDTAWFAMLDTEWPRMRANFQQWLALSNFDEHGLQKLSLVRLTRP